jgi:hypothetical protein
VYSEEAISKQQEEIALADVTEKELWVCPCSLTTSI